MWQMQEHLLRKKPCHKVSHLPGHGVSDELSSALATHREQELRPPLSPFFVTVGSNCWEMRAGGISANVFFLEICHFLSLGQKNPSQQMGLVGCESGSHGTSWQGPGEGLQEEISAGAQRALQGTDPCSGAAGCLGNGKAFLVPWWPAWGSRGTGC